jgi:hypothetical protein
LRKLSDACLRERLAAFSAAVEKAPKKYRPPKSDYQKDVRNLRILGVVAVIVVSAVFIFLVSGQHRLPWR